MAVCPTFYLTNPLTFHLACYLAFAWHFAWLIFCHSTWHSIWHLIWHTLWDFIWHVSAISAGILILYYIVAYFLTLFLAFKLTYFLTHCLKCNLEFSLVIGCGGPHRLCELAIVRGWRGRRGEEEEQGIRKSRDSLLAGGKSSKMYVPSGKLLHNYGKSQFLMGKLTINGHFQ